MKKRKLPPPPDVLSVNQVVAYNIRQLREARGWTQEEAAKELRRWTAWRWSQAVWSAAERAAQGKRSREFSVAELVAFACVFQIPVVELLMPPPGSKPHYPVIAFGESGAGTPPPPGTLAGAGAITADELRGWLAAWDPAAVAIRRTRRERVPDQERLLDQEEGGE